METGDSEGQNGIDIDNRFSTRVGMSETELTTSALDQMRKVSSKGAEYWMGRDLQALLGYADWDNFSNVVKKGMVACERAA